MGKFLCRLYAFNLAYQYFCAVRHADVRKFGNGFCRLTHYSCVQSAVYNNGFAYPFGFFTVKKITAAFGKFLFDFFVDLIKHYYRLLRRAYHTVIKGFGMNYRVYRKGNIRRGIDYRRGVSRTYAYCGLAA